MGIKARIGAFALGAALVGYSGGCGGGGGGGGGAVYDIQANYVSSQSVQPLGLIKVVVEAQNANAETFLRFFDGPGFDVLVPAIEVSTTQVTAAVPPYENPVSGQIEAGSVSVQVIQRTGGTEETSNPFRNVTVADLPACALTPGDLTLAVLQTIQSSLLSSSAAITGTSLDTAGNNASILAARNDVSALIGQVTAVQIDPLLSVDLGSIAGNQVFLTQADLAAADRLLAALVTQQNTVAQAGPAGCSFGCIDAELLALTGAIASGTPVQALVDAYFQAGLDCAVQSGLPLAWRFLTAGTAITSGALSEATVQNAPATALLLMQSYCGLAALSLAAALDVNTPNGIPELLDDSRAYLDLARSAAIAALAQAAGDLFTYLTGADDLAMISQTVPTFLVASPCATDLTGSWRGQYTFTIDLPPPCPPSITSSGQMELELTQAGGTVNGSGRVTDLTRLNQTNCSPAGTIAANVATVGTVSGLSFDGDLTVFEPSAGLSAALPFLSSIGTGLGGENTISGTFVFPDVTGSFELDRLAP